MKKFFLRKVAGMVVMGTILEAVLVSQIDIKCIGSPNNDTNPGISPVSLDCTKRLSVDIFSLNLETGTLCRAPGVCLASENNSDQDGAEIVETTETKNKGGIWKLKSLGLVNSFGLCLKRNGQKYESQLVQAKFCIPTRHCAALPLGPSVSGIQNVRFTCQLEMYNNAFTFEEDTGKICRMPGVCLASKNNSNVDRAEIVQSDVTTEKSGLWKFQDGSYVNGFGLCLEKDLDDSPSQLIQSKCNPQSYWQKYF